MAAMDESVYLVLCILCRPTSPWFNIGARDLISRVPGRWICTCVLYIDPNTDNVAYILIVNCTTSERSGRSKLS